MTLRPCEDGHRSQMAVGTGTTGVIYLGIAVTDRLQGLFRGSDLGLLCK